MSKLQLRHVYERETRIRNELVVCFITKLMDSCLLIGSQTAIGEIPKLTLESVSELFAVERWSSLAKEGFSKNSIYANLLLFGEL